MEKIENKENDIKEAIEQKFIQMDGFTGSIEDSWRKVKETLLENINNEIRKMKRAPTKPWIIETMINKMEERRKSKSQMSKKNAQ